MAKKPRSQRRKQKGGGSSNFGDEEDGGGGGGDNAVDALSETHTIADDVSLSTIFDNNGDLEYDNDEALDINDHDVNDYSTKEGEQQLSQLEKRQMKLLDCVNSIITLPTEKRSATREILLKKFYRGITQYATGNVGREAICSKEKEIIHSCTYGLRGKPAEQYASCRCLEALSIILGGDNDEYYNKIYKYLIRIIKTSMRATMVRCAALRALSMCNFICAVDESTTTNLLNLCEDICGIDKYKDNNDNDDVNDDDDSDNDNDDDDKMGHNSPPLLCATALDCWALLLTTANNEYVAGEDEESQHHYVDNEEYRNNNGRGIIILPLLKEFLDHPSSIELRSAAGECLALIHECRLSLGATITNDDDDGGGENKKKLNASERRYNKGSWVGSQHEILIDDIKYRINELTNESGHHMSKKDKKEQRAIFRDYMSTIMDDEYPEEVITFSNSRSDDPLTLNTWKSIIQLNFIRHCLQGGFQIQLMTNETIQYIFNLDSYSSGSSNNYSSLEKRLYLSKSSSVAKNNDKYMTKQRKQKQNKKNYFLTSDGDDI